LALPTYRLRLTLGAPGGRREREQALARLARELGRYGLLGIHEGTVLSETAAREGLETSSWTVDSAEAPGNRDWVGELGGQTGGVELYFSNQEGAAQAAARLALEPGCLLGPLEEEPARDWDAEWKKAFLAQSRGFAVPPNWRVVPAFEGSDSVVEPGEIPLRINPGAGFGTGTHETTQLCLSAIAGAWKGPLVEAGAALDFGSGSGILSIALAKLGARVVSVEIDPLAIDNASENARLNGVQASISQQRELGPETPGPFSLIVANILRPVLLEQAPALVRRLAERGVLVLSGLIEADVAEVSARYGALLGARGRPERPETQVLNEWRCLIWRFTEPGAAVQSSETNL
jgi:ribosomal protein L11 methyltransferase